MIRRRGRPRKVQPQPPDAQPQILSLSPPPSLLLLPQRETIAGRPPASQLCQNMNNNNKKAKIKPTATTPVSPPRNLNVSNDRKMRYTSRLGQPEPIMIEVVVHHHWWIWHREWTRTVVIAILSTKLESQRSHIRLKLILL